MRVPGRSLQACAECRKSKLKCDGMFAKDSICTRCRKRKTQCIWPSLMPDQVPGPSTGLLQAQEYSNSADDGSRTTQSHFASANEFLQAEPSSLHARSPQSQDVEIDDPCSYRPYKRIRAHPAPLIHLREHDSLSSASSPASFLSPNNQKDGTLSPQYHKEKGEAFEVQSLQTLLSQQNWTQAQMQSLDMERKLFFHQVTATEPASINDLDPVENGLIDNIDVIRLFEVYYKAINPQQGLSNPNIDTPTAVRLTSRALFIAILAVSASVDDHPRSKERYAALNRCLDTTVSLLLSSNAKSPSVVKTLLLAYHFSPKPACLAEDHCWHLVDTAIRIATELGLGQNIRKQKVSIVNPEYADRSGDRAWIFAIVAQRSLSTMSGMWSTNALDVSWKHLEMWSECKTAMYGDVQLAAYLFLRNLECNVREQIECIKDGKFLTAEGVRVNCNKLFDAWRLRWVDHAKIVNEPFSRNYLLTIGLHIQLLLNVTLLLLDQEQQKAQNSSLHNGTTKNASDEVLTLATDLCKHFIASFDKQAHQLARHFAAMITWSAIAMLQMSSGANWTLACRIAVMLAGDANELDKRHKYSCFYGRLLLSFIYKSVDMNHEADSHDKQMQKDNKSMQIAQEGNHQEAAQTIQEFDPSVIDNIETDLLNSSWLSQFFGSTDDFEVL